MPRWFRVPLSLELGQGWGGIRDDKARQVNLARGENAVGRPTLWFGPYAVPTADADEFVAELRATPFMTFEEAVPVEVAGYAGEQFDAQAAEDAEEPGNTTRVPGTIDILAMRLLHSRGITDFSWYTESVAARLRFILVDVGEETLVIYVEAPPAEFEEFASRQARTVLESMRVFPRS